jgi:hypothetical protein
MTSTPLIAPKPSSAEPSLHTQQRASDPQERVAVTELASDINGWSGTMGRAAVPTRASRIKAGWVAA